MGVASSIAALISAPFREAFIRTYNLSTPPRLEVVLEEPSITLIIFGRAVTISGISAWGKL